LIKAESKEYYEGKIDMTGRKTAYFVCPELEEDVPTNNLNHALDKDIVKVYFTTVGKKDLKVKLLK
jgi:ribonuclease R